MALINVSQYMTLSVIGKGNNPVLKVQSFETQEMYALKKVVRNIFEHHIADLQEITMLASISHPNIIRIIGFETKQIVKNTSCSYVLYILMDLLKKNMGEEVTERRKKLSYFSYEELKRIICELLAALHYLHEKGIAHRDLKPENVLVGGENQIILTDFNDAFMRNEIRPNPKTIVGSPYYMSPELRRIYIENDIITNDNYDAYKSDVFSLGMTLLDISSLSIGEAKNVKEKQEIIKKKYGEKFMDFLNFMLEPDFSKRKTVKEIQDYFLQNIYCEQSEKNEEISSNNQNSKDFLGKEIENMQNLPLTQEAFELFSSMSMDDETKRLFLENLVKLSELEEENQRLKAKKFRAKKIEELEIIEKKEKIQNCKKKTKKESFFKTISSIFCVPT